MAYSASPSLAITATVQTNLPIVGALISPVGFVMIILLGLDMVTGSFALLPMAQMGSKINLAATLRNWAWVFLGNLLGSMFYARLLWIALTMMGESPAGILLGAKTTLGDLWLWNQIPVTLGNLAGGFLFTGLALYLTYRTRETRAPAAQAAPSTVP